VATFIVLGNFTDQGIRNFKDSPKRADAFGDVLQQHGGSLTAIYWTVGGFDLVAIAEAPDADSATAALLQVAALGNVRTTTLLAFDKDRFSAIIDRTG
jgi:uncharacterized protein with GYD domain